MDGFVLISEHNLLLTILQYNMQHFYSNTEQSVRKEH